VTAETVILQLQMLSSRRETRNCDVSEQYVANNFLSPRNSEFEDRTPALERVLLVSFLIVAAVAVFWHLGTSLEWLWTNCASQLHSAVVKSGIA